MRELLKELQLYLEEELSKINIENMYDKLISDKIIDRNSFNYLLELTYFLCLIKENDDDIQISVSFYAQSKDDEVEFTLVRYAYILSRVLDIHKKKSDIGSTFYF